MSGQGKRYNDGKTMMELLPPDVHLAVAKVMTMGAQKYDANNWAKGMPFSGVLGCLKRHLAKFEMGLDIDEESGQHHIDHVLCNAMFLARFVRSSPEYDDRFLPFIQNHKRVALDIDGVIADFMTPALKRMGIKGKGGAAWYSSYKFKDPSFWEEIVQDKEFWLSLEPLLNPNELDFEPIAYVTARGIPKEWTEEWLEKNGFPCNDVHVVKTKGGDHESKVDVLKRIECDVFVDDHYKHFLDINRSDAKCKCFLQDTYYNARYKVGGLRIKHPNEALGYTLKEWT